MDKCQAEDLAAEIKPLAEAYGVAIGVRRHAVGTFFVYAKRKGWPQWKMESIESWEAMRRRIEERERPEMTEIRPTTDKKTDTDPKCEQRSHM